MKGFWLPKFIRNKKWNDECEVVEAWRVLNFLRRSAVGYQLEGNAGKNPISHSISRATWKRSSPPLPLSSAFGGGPRFRCDETTREEKRRRTSLYRLFPYPWRSSSLRRFFSVLREIGRVISLRWNGSSNTESRGLLFDVAWRGRRFYFAGNKLSTTTYHVVRGGNNAETTNNGGTKLRRELKRLSSFMARYILETIYWNIFFFSTTTQNSSFRAKLGGKMECTMNARSTWELFIYKYHRSR